MRKLFLILILISLISLPFVLHAQSIIPCTNTPGPDGVIKDPCDFPALMQLFSNGIGFLVKIALPLATITIIYAGFTYLTTAISDQKSKAKQMMINVVIGFAVLLAAFIIVRTIVNTLVDPTFKLPVNLEG